MTRVLTVVLFALALLAAPLTTEADRAPRIPRIGVVYIRSRDPLQNGPAEVWRSLPHVQAVLAGLKERHWVEGRDFVLDIRPVEHFSHVRGQVAGLVTEKVDVLLFQTCDAEFHIARQVTRTIPIVVGPCTDDLVGKGIVASLGRPGGNITGISLLTPELSAKRLFLLKEVVPTLSRVTVLWNPMYRDFELDWRDLRAAAATMAVTLHSLEVRGPGLDPVLAFIVAREGADGLLGFPDRTHYLFPKFIADLAARTRLPVISAHRVVPEAGGLMSYGANVLELYQRLGTCIAHILAGANPADLPIEQPTKFEFVINLKTAKALGLTIPPSVLARADEVMQ